VHLAVDHAGSPALAGTTAASGPSRSAVAAFVHLDRPRRTVEPDEVDARALSDVMAAPISVPGSMRPVISMVTWPGWHDATVSHHGAMARRDAALPERRSNIVSTSRRSTPPSSSRRPTPRSWPTGRHRRSVQRGELRPRTDGSGDEPWRARAGVVVGHSPRDRGRGQRELVSAVRDAVLAEHDTERAE